MRDTAAGHKTVRGAVASIWYGSRQTAAVTGLSLRQLQFWHDQVIIEPSGGIVNHKRRYSWSDLQTIRVIRALRSKGMTLAHIRPLVKQIRKTIETIKRMDVLDAPRPTLIVATGGRIDRCYREHPKSAYEILRASKGAVIGVEVA